MTHVLLDAESRAWLDDLRGLGREEAVARLRARLDDFRGASRFTTWAYKFALLEAAVKIRRRAWQGREVPLDPESWTLMPSLGATPEEDVEQAALLRAIRDGIEHALTDNQRTVLVALALNGVPIDVLAERQGTTRGALYVELELAGEDADRIVPGLGPHLRGCPACREEHESLRDLLAAEPPPAGRMPL